jgi:hypothetical protein
MANEFKHDSVGTQLTQAEWEDVGGHVLDSQATGDLIYATSSSQLSRLGIGSTGAILTVTGGVPVWDTTWTPTGHLIPASDDSYDLGSSSAAWQDLFLEGDITLTDAGTLATSAGALTITSAAAATWSTSAGALTLTSAGALNLNPASGSAIVLDSTINVDAGVVTGATSITSTAFVGTLSTAAQTNITSLGTLTTLTVDNIIINGTNIGHTSDTDSIAIASDGVVTMNQIPVFSAGINVSGGSIAGTLSTAAQANITSLGTLTALTVDDVAVDGKVVTMTGSASDTAVFTAGTNGTLSIVTTDAAAAAANIQITADGTVDIDSAGVLTLDSGAAINIEPASGSAILLDGTISIDAGVVTGATSITSTAFVGDITGDVTGNADTATLATSFTASANNTADETVYPVFVDGATGTQGAETDTGLTYNPSSGVLTSTQFTGALSGNASTATALATARAINGVNFDGSAAITVTAAGSTLSDTVTVAKGGTNATSLADKAVLITQDSGTDTVAAAAMTTSGQLLIGGASGPAVSTLTAGSNVTITNADGAITIASTQATDATNSSHVLVTDNESTNENNLITFVENATDSTGNVGLEMDGTLTYNPSTGKVTATGFIGALTGQADTVATIAGLAPNTATTQATQPNITSLGTLTTLTVDNVITNGTTIGHTDDTDLMTLADGSLTLAGNLTLADDTSITLGDEGMVIFSDVAPSTDDKGTGIVIKGVATSNVVSGDALYLKADGQYERADKDAETTMPAVGVALADGDGSAEINILIYGVYVNAGLSLTRGEELYVSDNGAVTHTVPGSGDFLQRVGVALSTTSVLFMPSLDVIEHA